jgi:predicted transposase/invertase (TIGR01784 family)
MANKYDKIFKENIEAMYLSLSEKLLDMKLSQTEDMVVDLHRTVERKPDFLKKVIGNEKEESFLLHIEIQTADDSEMMYRMYEYHAMLLRKFKLKVVQLVFYFGKGLSKMKNAYSDGNNSYSFQLFSIQSISYKTFLASNKPEELLLAVLADFEKEAPEDILKLLFSKAKVLTNETFTLDKFVSQLEILSKLRNLEDIFKTLIQKIMPLEIKIEETFIYKEGKVKGRIEGKEEGKIEGKKEGKIEMILALLKKGELSQEKIADAADVSLEYVKELADNL